MKNLKDNTKRKRYNIMAREIYQGQIYVCDLGNNNVGSEQCGKRPCLVIQNNVLNATSEITIVIPITSKRKKSLPTHYILKNTKYNFLDCCENTVLCECIRSVSKKRLGQLLGQIDNDDLEMILQMNEYAYKIANKINKERRANSWME